MDYLQEMAQQRFDAKLKELAGLSAVLRRASPALRQLLVSRAWCARSKAIRGWKKNAPREHEISCGIAERVGQTPYPGHAFVPLDGLATRSGAIVGTATVGGDLVETENETPGIAFLNALRAQSLALQLGVEVIGGLQGELTLPYISSGLTGYWLSDELTAASESDWTLAQLPANSPKTCGLYRSLAAPAVARANADVLLMADLGRTVATAVDVALITTAPAALGSQKG